jgi:signal transduction histidine kinase
MRRSIRTRLLIAFIGLAVGPLLLVGILLGWQSYTIQQQQALVLEHEVSLRVSTQVASFIQRLESDLSLLIKVRGLTNLDQDQQRSLLSEMLQYQPTFNELALLDSKGQEQVRISRLTLVSAGDLRDESAADEFVTPLRTGKTYYSPVRVDQTTGEPLMTIALPIIDLRSGAVSNVLVATLRFKPIWDLITTISEGSVDTIYIVDSQGSVVAHREPSLVLKGTHFNLPDQDGLHPGLLGTDVILASNKLQFGEQAFTVVAERPLSDALALAISTVLITTLLVVVVLVVATALGYVTVRRIIEPVRGLAEAAQAIMAGDLTRQVTVASNDELGDLASAFNSMTAQLRKTLEGLREHVADLEKARAERERLIRELREASRLKSEFLSTMSHELRTPLNAMIGFTELMIAGVSGPMSDKQKHQLGRIHANSLRLLSLIDHVLDLSRIEAGRIEIQNEPFSPREMVARVTAQTSSLLEGKPVKFSVDIAETLPATVLGDPARIEQIVINLLSNAFKFTEKGDVVLSVSPLLERGQWSFSVRDTGIGIPPHAQEYIFEEFRQVDGSARRMYGGSGLGLTICRNLCRLMDGDIRVQSTLGVGSTFTVTLPLKVSEPAVLSTN